MNGYRALAEFNGAVLAGTETLLGAQFVTWPGGCNDLRCGAYESCSAPQSASSQAAVFMSSGSGCAPVGSQGSLTIRSRLRSCRAYPSSIISIGLPAPEARFSGLALCSR